MSAERRRLNQRIKRTRARIRREMRLLEKLLDLRKHKEAVSA